MSDQTPPPGDPRRPETPRRRLPKARSRPRPAVPVAEPVAAAAPGAVPLPPGYVPQPYAPLPPGTPVTPDNSSGTIALVMGILQFFCLPLIASVLAIIFGRIGMNKAKKGLATNGGVATAGFWLGIAGLILSIIGLIAAVFLIGWGVQAVNENLDPARNAETGLADGSYVMNPSSSIHINDECNFGGTPVDVNTTNALPTSVNVVGRGVMQCGTDMGTPNTVFFTVTQGVATITGVQ